MSLEINIFASGFRDNYIKHKIKFRWRIYFKTIMEGRVTLKVWANKLFRFNSNIEFWFFGTYLISFLKYIKKNIMNFSNFLTLRVRQLAQEYQESVLWMTYEQTSHIVGP
jgi:hypothetical protein